MFQWYKMGEISYLCVLFPNSPSIYIYIYIYIYNCCRLGFHFSDYTHFKLIDLSTNTSESLTCLI
jgi:hypothetical protein